MPLLESAYSAATRRHLLTLAALARDDDELLDSLARDSAATLLEPSLDLRALRASAAELLALQPSFRRRVVRQAIGRLAGTLDDVTAYHVEAVLDRAARATGAVRLPHGLEARRMGGWIVFETADEPETEFAADLEKWPVAASGLALPVSPGSKLNLQSGWRFEATTAQRRACEPQGNLAACFDLDALAEEGGLELRTRRPGDYITPHGMRGRKALQDLMVDARIPAYLRDRLPLLALADTSRVLWVPGVGGRRSEIAPVGPETKTTLVVSFERATTT
jgi:tRNA(Ile)-lysidine synthase